MNDHCMGAVPHWNTVVYVLYRKDGVFLSMYVYKVGRIGFLLPVHHLINRPVNVVSIPDAQVFFIQFQAFAYSFTKGKLCQHFHIIHKAGGQQFVNPGIPRKHKPSWEFGNAFYTGDNDNFSAMELFRHFLYKDTPERYTNQNRVWGAYLLAKG